MRHDLIRKFSNGWIGGNTIKTPRVVLSIEYLTEYGRGLLRGISKYVRLHGQWTFLGMPRFHSNPEDVKYTKNFNDIKKFAPDGVILRTSDNYEKLKKLGIPILLADGKNEALDDAPRIVSDDESIARMAADYLRGIGFMDFAYCGIGDLEWSLSRGDAFEQVLSEAGHKVHRHETRDDLGQENNDQLLGRWLQHLPKPIGLFCCTDSCSQQVAEVSKSIGISIPDEIALLGVDNDDLYCTLTDPPLSSIAMDTETAGYKAAELLARLMDGKKPQSQRIVVKPTKVVPRLSTEIIALDDKEVAKAMRFILTHVRGWIQVEDVAEHVGLSRRTLERRFGKLLHRSVYGEIKKTRTQLVSRMLLETNLTMSQISYSLGYPSPGNMTQSFRRETGLTPKNYRIWNGKAVKV